METVKVKDVEAGKNGWREITLEDGRTVSTKNKAIADAAFASRGTEVEVEINSVQRGSFTNHYLNKFGDISDERDSDMPKSAPRKNGSGFSPKNQDDIAKQWAIGRSVELLALSDSAVKFPLDDDTVAAIQLSAQTLLDLRKKLK